MKTTSSAITTRLWKTRLFAAAFLTCAMAVTSASGALIMTINTTDKTYAFTGSVAGQTTSGLRFAQWSYSYTHLIAGISYFDDKVQVTSSPDALTGNVLWMSTDGSTYADLTLQFNWPVANASETLTGTGVTQSYAALSASNQLQFEDLIGKRLTDSQKGFGDIAVVPEPTSCALLGLGAAALTLRRRARKV